MLRKRVRCRLYMMLDGMVDLLGRALFNDDLEV